MAQRTQAAASPLKIVIVGHVDHGKSTLIGRLLHDSGALPDGRAEELRASSEKRGMPIEWSFALDSFQAERDQAITIDTTQVRFSSARRPYVIIDAPGHAEFLRNMISGATASDAAVLVVDVVEGIKDQTRRHCAILDLLGIDQLVVAVNKMDAVGFAQPAFDAAVRDLGALLAESSLAVEAFVPISARSGDNLIARSPRMPWHGGEALVEVLDRLAARRSGNDLPLRLPIQDVYKFDERRILAGRVESGVLRKGDRLLFSPSNKTAVVARIESFGEAPPERAVAGQSVGFTLDRPLFVERGEIASHVEDPPAYAHAFRARMLWLGDEPLRPGRELTLRVATRQARARVETIERALDVESMGDRPTEELGRNMIGVAVLRCPEVLALDAFKRIQPTGRFVLADGGETLGGGIVDLSGFPDLRRRYEARPENLFRVAHQVTAEMRVARNGHRGTVIWLTGLSGAGKSTIAMALELELFRRGMHSYVLDGDNVRHGLSADLGFSADDRAENIRRVGEVAALFAEAGLVAIVAFISPYRADRERARASAKGKFLEVHVKASLATCERRDTKGLYKRARAGELREFTGVSAPYEPPAAPELVLDTETASLEECVQALTLRVAEAIR